MNAYSSNYLKNQIDTASREQLLIMFYDGALRFTAQAGQAIKDGHIERRNYAINKATAILSELAATLDHSIGEKIAEDLDALYAYMIGELNKANWKNNAALLEPVESILTELRQTWQQAIDLNRKPAQPAPLHAGQAQHSPFSVSL